MCAYRTAWSRKTTSLTSDRIPSPHPITQRSSPKPSSGGKGKKTELVIPKSREVIKLEELRDALQDSIGRPPAKDPTHGGCFCQAREHKLSPHTPICRHCGLILCELNLPCYACPHCKSALLSPEASKALVVSLEDAVVDTLEREERARQEAAEEVRRAAGAFPTLGAPASDASLRSLSNSSNPGPIESHPINQQHKVLSLNSTGKGKRVTVTSYKTVTPPATSSLVKHSQDPPEPEVRRVSRPPKEVPYLSKADVDRPWRNPRVEPVTYIPPPQDNSAGSSKGRPKRKGKKTNKAQETGKENSEA